MFVKEAHALLGTDSEKKSCHQMHSILGEIHLCTITMHNDIGI